MFFVRSLIFLFSFYILHADSTAILQQADNAYQKKEYLQAFSQYKILADQNNSAALQKIGLMYELGKGCDQNYTLAKQYYTKASELGNIDAHYNLGLLFQMSKDYNQSISYYTYAADKGHTASQHNLANLYELTNPPYQDLKKACHYYQMASENNFTLSQLPLATMYVLGKGCDKNETKALLLYKSVLLHKDSQEAQHNAALMIARGLGMPQNNILAYALWENNANLGYEPSKYNAAVLKKRMDPIDLSKAQALAKNRKKMIEMIIAK
ncbi:MAG: tetratricopeptide repeat protein [Sulfuricurvum sp.]|uniref:tetratricopeptide repeat protein n=1 Tax=Sulfuricurvum sp. TaxID=2025608 RepID=UPI00356A6046